MGRRDPAAAIQQWRNKQRARYGARLAKRAPARAVKLGKRKNAIVGFTVDGILSRITAAQSSGPDVEKFKAIGRVGGSILAAIRYRRQVMGEYPSGQKALTLRGQKTPADIDNRYLRSAGIDSPDKFTGDVTTGYENWRTLGQIGGITGQYNTSGGMWAGMESRLLGTSIIHEPVGKSLGATGRTGGTQQNWRVPKGERARKKFAGMIPNRDKTYLVWLMNKDNPIEPKQAELDKAALVLAFDLTAGHIAGWAATQSWVDKADAVESALWYGTKER